MENGNKELIANDYPITRKCSFNPARYLIPIASLNDPTAIEYYLAVKFRVMWFVIYCEEHGINGFIDDSEIKFLDGSNMVIATCTVYMDGEIAAKASAGRVMDADNGNTIIQSVTTSAKGRALSNLGFGVSLGASDEGEDIPCDTGIEASIIFNNDNPMLRRYNNEQAVSDKDTVSDKAKDDSHALNTRQDALSYVCKTGKYSGKTMGEINALDPQYIKWVAEKMNRNPEMKKAAQLIIS